jgi:hypothetical protein
MLCCFAHLQVLSRWLPVSVQSHTQSCAMCTSPSGKHKTSAFLKCIAAVAGMQNTPRFKFLRRWVQECMPCGKQAGHCSTAGLNPSDGRQDLVCQPCCAGLPLQRSRLTHIFHHVILDLTGCQLDVHRECMDLQGVITSDASQKRKRT